MRVDRTFIAAILVVITPLHVQAQQNSREQARINNQQSGPRDRLEDRWQSYSKYDYNRPEKGQPRYYANRYYRDSRYYRTRPLTRIDRIYRGSDHLYYWSRGLLATATVTCWRSADRIRWEQLLIDQALRS
jgi:hypothetical protein